MPVRGRPLAAAPARCDKVASLKAYALGREGEEGQGEGEGTAEGDVADELRA
jgi:hypothetical protein